MDKFIKKELASSGTLRAAINLSNFLLVSGRLTDGAPDGISPDVAKQVAAKIGVPCQLISYDRPGLVADAITKNEWDIGNIAAEAKRAEVINFSNPYVTIDANFLTRSTANFNNNSDVNTAGVKIAVSERSAYDLWLTENFREPEIVRATTIQDSHEMFIRGEVDVLASLKPKLLEDLSSIPNVKMIDTPFTSINQSIGVKKSNSSSLAFLNELIENLLKSGFIEESLHKHGVDKKLSIPKNK